MHRGKLGHTDTNLFIKCHDRIICCLSQFKLNSIHCVASPHGVMISYTCILTDFERSPWMCITGLATTAATSTSFYMKSLIMNNIIENTLYLAATATLLTYIGRNAHNECGCLQFSAHLSSQYIGIAISHN